MKKRLLAVLVAAVTAVAADQAAQADQAVQMQAQVMPRPAT